MFWLALPKKPEFGTLGAFFIGSLILLWFIETERKNSIFISFLFAIRVKAMEGNKNQDWLDQFEFLITRANQEISLAEKAK